MLCCAVLPVHTVLVFYTSTVHLCLACGRPTTGLPQRALGGTFTLQPSSIRGAQLTWQVTRAECAPASYAGASGNAHFSYSFEKRRQCHYRFFGTFSRPNLCRDFFEELFFASQVLENPKTPKPQERMIIL